MTDIEKASEDTGVVTEEQAAPKVPEFLRRAAMITLSDPSNMWGKSYTTEDFAVDALLGPWRPAAESEEK